MAMRWIAAILLAASVTGASAQLGKDPENPLVVRPDPKPAPSNAIPASQTNAEAATESPATNIAQAKQAGTQPPCDPANPCAMPTPAAH